MWSQLASEIRAPVLHWTASSARFRCPVTPRVEHAAMSARTSCSVNASNGISLPRVGCGARSAPRSPGVDLEFLDDDRRPRPSCLPPVLRLGRARRRHKERKPRVAPDGRRIGPSLHSDLQARELDLRRGSAGVEHRESISIVAAQLENLDCQDAGRQSVRVAMHVETAHAVMLVASSV